MTRSQEGDWWSGGGTLEPIFFASRSKRENVAGGGTEGSTQIKARYGHLKGIRGGKYGQQGRERERDMERRKRKEERWKGRERKREIWVKVRDMERRRRKEIWKRRKRERRKYR